MVAEAKEQEPLERPLLCGRLLLGMTGSVGALLMPQWVFRLRQGVVGEVRVMMSRSACRFVRPYAMRLCSGNWVFTDDFAGTEEFPVPHIGLARWAELFLVMPASANILAKAAYGLADDLVSTTLLACRAPVVFVPNMNQAMWEHRAVQENVARCKRLGYHVLEPATGYEVSTGEPGVSAMPPLEAIVAELQRILDEFPSRGLTDPRE
jgi:phosphopantothenoylcysteine decarboxylase/phosphopantothenate--cysteine ligase